MGTRPRRTTPSMSNAIPKEGLKIHKKSTTSNQNFELFLASLCYDKIKKVWIKIQNHGIFTVSQKVKA